MHTALRATSKTLADYLEGCLRRDAQLRMQFDAASGGQMVVSLSSPQQMLQRPAVGLSVWLYRTQRDEMQSNDPPARIDRDHWLPPPLPLRLYYLVTPVSGSGRDQAPDTEQLILGKVMQCLHGHPVLAGADLRDDFEGTATVLHVRLESLPLDEVTRIWDVLDTALQLSAAYEVSVVHIGAQRSAERIAPVEVVMPAYGPAGPMEAAR